jgi:hypothetical protein
MAVIVVAIRGNLITAHEVLRRYKLSFEELEIWQREFDRNGIKGLRVTRIKPRRS